MRASSESGGRSRSQHSQLGLSCSKGVSPSRCRVILPRNAPPGVAAANAPARRTRPRARAVDYLGVIGPGRAPPPGRSASGTTARARGAIAAKEYVMATYVVLVNFTDQ